MPDFKDASIADFLPSSLKKDERVVAVAEAANEQLQCIDVQRELLHVIANIDWSDEDIIELLAWQWHVDFWDDSLSLMAKRDLVKNSSPWHRRKGTPAVVEEMARLILKSAKISEWFAYEDKPGKPYFFRIECTELVQDTETFDKIIELVLAVQNVRSWLEAVRVYRERTMDLYFGSVQRAAKTMSIYAETVDAIGHQHHLYAGQAQQLTKFIQIYPQEAII